MAFAESANCQVICLVCDSARLNEFLKLRRKENHLHFKYYAVMSQSSDYEDYYFSLDVNTLTCMKTRKLQCKHIIVVILRNTNCSIRTLKNYQKISTFSLMKKA